MINSITELQNKKTQEIYNRSIQNTLYTGLPKIKRNVALKVLLVKIKRINPRANKYTIGEKIRINLRIFFGGTVNKNYVSCLLYVLVNVIREFERNGNGHSIANSNNFTKLNGLEKNK